MTSTTEELNVHVRIEHDDDPQNPRKEWENPTIMRCWHPRYDLGDETVRKPECKEDFDDIVEDFAIYLPLYLYDHGGVTMNTTGFTCPWDSGQVGVIGLTQASIDEHWSETTYPLDIGENTYADQDEFLRYVLTTDVKTYDQYLTSDVWGYVVEVNGEHEESCFGFFGQADARYEGKLVADYVRQRIIDERETEAAMLSLPIDMMGV